MSARISSVEHVTKASEVSTAPVVSRMGLWPIRTRVQDSAMIVFGNANLLAQCSTYLRDAEMHRLACISKTVHATQDHSLILHLRTGSRIYDTDYPAYRRARKLPSGNFKFLTSCHRVQQAIFHHLPHGMHALDFFYTLHFLPSLTSITCVELTDKMVQTLHKSYPRIKTVVITGRSCTCLESLVELKNKGINVVGYSITYCKIKELTEQTLNDCVAICPNVTHITCNKVSLAVLNRFSAIADFPLHHLKNLTVLHLEISENYDIYRTLLNVANRLHELRVRFRVYTDELGGQNEFYYDSVNAPWPDLGGYWRFNGNPLDFVL